MVCLYVVNLYREAAFSIKVSVLIIFTAQKLKMLINILIYQAFFWKKKLYIYSAEKKRKKTGKDVECSKIIATDKSYSKIMKVMS